MRVIVFLPLLGIFFWGSLEGQAPSACIQCHQNIDFVGEEGAQIVALAASDVHYEVGITCHGCHGGNPDPNLAEDPEASMDPDYSPSPFKPVPGPAEIPRFCGSCHSDPVYMRRFKPGVRVDQESEYWTSQHGELLKQGDEDVATCVSCHDAHGVRRVSHPDAPVYPRNVAQTCNSCHGDGDLMGGRTADNGQPVSIDQFDLWRESVHGRALLEREDLSAPACNDCHGNHGATPPGLDSIIFVCGQCHGREARLFRESPKFEAWERHNEYLMEAGDEGCLACHEESSPMARLTGIRSFGECTLCHGDHGVARPTVALFSPLPDTPCAFCHESQGPLAEESPELSSAESNYHETRNQLLLEAQSLGLEAEERFDWLVDQTLQLIYHRLGRTGSQTGTHPEFQRLFDKFRIGKTHFEYGSQDGQSKKVPLVRCTDCHAGGGGEHSGLLTGVNFLSRMQELTALTARAERLLLAARRGGVESRSAFLEVDKAVDSQIGLEVLVHTFAVEGDFEQTHQEGMEHVRAALTIGRQAQDELQRRRWGLAVSLIFILLLLIGLGLKIRWSSP